MKLQNHAYPRRFAVLGAVFAAALFGSVLLGRFSVTPKELFRLLLSRLTETEPGWRDGAENVVFQIRLPRVAAAALIGAALAAAGVSYQGMFRNPMVSPDILGASTGAGFGAALAILLGAGYFGISMSAFVFGLLAVAAAYAVSCMSRTNQTIALILSGMMVSSLFSAGTSYLKLVAAADPELAHEPADARRGGGALHGREYPPAAIHRHPLRDAADGVVRRGLRYDRLGRPCHPAFLPDAVRL